MLSEALEQLARDAHHYSCGGGLHLEPEACLLLAAAFAEYAADARELERAAAPPMRLPRAANR